MELIEPVPTANQFGPALHDALDALPDFIYTFDLGGRFTYANLALVRLLERTSDEMVGANFHDLGYPYELACKLQAQIQEVIDTRSVVCAETHFEAASGAGEYEYIFAPILDPDGKVTAVAGTTRNVTQRRQAEEALQSSQREVWAEREKLRTLFEQAPAFMAMLTGPSFIFEYANEAYYRLIGRDDVLGMTVEEVLPEVVKQGYIDLLTAVYTTGEPFIGRGMELVFDAGNGQQDRHYLDFIYQAIRNSAGEIEGVLAHGVDVTDQVLTKQEIERLNTELELRVEERTLELQSINRELEGFTYSVSHDLRAPLRAIVSSSEILLQDYGETLSKDAQHELRRQVTASNKLATLIDDLLKLSRLARQEMRKRPVNLSEVAQEVWSEISNNLLSNRCQLEIEPNMHAVADPVTVRLLLLNLIVNACKFSPGEARVVVGQTVSSGQASIFWVRDQGIGFDMRYVEKVFLPFERLVSEQQFPGSGIGLANAKRIVERHGGRIWAESAPGEGATFFFTLGS